MSSWFFCLLFTMGQAVLNQIVGPNFHDFNSVRRAQKVVEAREVAFHDGVEQDRSF
jgi:hypothetical protein